jgi:hypothetical protein
VNTVTGGDEQAFPVPGGDTCSGYEKFMVTAGEKHMDVGDHDTSAARIRWISWPSQ